MATKGYTVNVRVGATISDFDKKMQKVTKQISKIGKSFKNTGEALTRNISLPILGATTALAGIVMSSARSADELMRLSDVTGMSTDEIQKLQYVAQQLGTDFETIEGAQGKLTKKIAEAVGGNKDAIKAFEELGIKIFDVNGKLKDAPTIFGEVLDALGKMEDPVMRDASAMDLMGKSARDLNPLIKAGSDEINRLKQEAMDTGAVLSEETVKKLAEFNDKVDAMKSRLQVAGAELGTKLLPLFEKLIDFIEKKAVPFMQNLIDKFLELPSSVQNILLILGALLAILPPLIMFLGAIALSVSAISLPVLGVVAGIAALIAIIVALWLNWDKVQAFFLATWELIKKAFMFTFENVPLLRLFKSIYDNWDKITNFFLTTWEMIKKAFKASIDWIVDLFEGFVNKWIDRINLLIQAVNFIPGVDIKKFDNVDFNKSVTSTSQNIQPINVFVGGQKLNNIIDYSLGTKAFS